MEKTISKKRLLNLLLISFALPAAVAGCGTLSDPKAVASDKSTTSAPSATAKSSEPRAAAPRVRVRAADEDHSPIVSDNSLADLTPASSFDEPAAVDSKSAGSCEIRPSPMVKMV